MLQDTWAMSSGYKKQQYVARKLSRIYRQALIEDWSGHMASQQCNPTALESERNTSIVLGSMLRPSQCCGQVEQEKVTRKQMSYKHLPNNTLELAVLHSNREISFLLLRKTMGQCERPAVEAPQFERPGPCQCPRPAGAHCS